MNDLTRRGFILTGAPLTILPIGLLIARLPFALADNKPARRRFRSGANRKIRGRRNSPRAWRPYQRSSRATPSGAARLVRTSLTSRAKQIPSGLSAARTIKITNSAFIVVSAAQAALFSSDTKFDSSTGWPNFWAPIAKENVVSKIDLSFGMSRDSNLRPLRRASGPRL